MESTKIIEFIIKYFYWIFLGLILLTFMQKKHGNKGYKKRMAVLLQAILIFLIMVYATILNKNNLTDKFLIPAVIIVTFILFFGRSKILPYKFRCRGCGKRMNFEHIFYYDNPLCKECDSDIIEVVEEAEEKTSSEEE